MNAGTGKKHLGPLLACVLIGGKSSRMGWPKHLLRQADRFWLEHTVATTTALVDAVFLAGAGEIPSSLTQLARLRDASGVCGPMAGILAALRHHPEATWLILACDLPALRADSLAWLLAETRPEDLAVLPCMDSPEQVEPLFACYSGRCLPHLEALAADGTWSLAPLRHVPGVRTPLIPPALRPAWRNINTPQQLRRYLREIGALSPDFPAQTLSHARHR